MVVTSTTVSHTVLATFLGVEVGILSQVFSGTPCVGSQPGGACKSSLESACTLARHSLRSHSSRRRAQPLDQQQARGLRQLRPLASRGKRPR